MPPDRSIDLPGSLFQAQPHQIIANSPYEEINVFKKISNPTSLILFLPPTRFPKGNPKINSVAGHHLKL